MLLMCCLTMGPMKTVRGDNDVLRNLIEKGDFQAALAVVDAGLKGRPEDRSLLLHRGFLLVSLGRLEEAEGHYQDMKTTFPDMPEPGTNLAVVYRNQGRMHAALLELADVIQGFPLFEQAHDNLKEICQTDMVDIDTEETEVKEFCDSFDHEAADRARKAARDALPLVVEKNNVVEVIALRQVEFTSAPLDDDEQAGVGFPDANEVNESLQRELADLAAEFESFRSRKKKELDAALTAKTVAEDDVARVQAENVELEQQLAATVEEVTSLEQRLAQMEKQREEFDQSMNAANTALSEMETAVQQSKEDRMTAEQSATELKAELHVSQEKIERIELVQIELQSEVAAATKSLTDAEEQLLAERVARATAERQVNELEILLAGLKAQVDTLVAASEVTGQEAMMPSMEVEEEQPGEEAHTPDPIEVTGAAEGQVSAVTAKNDANELEFDRWLQRLEQQQLQGNYLKPPDHIQWQVEHVLTRWFETFQSGDVDAHLALYSPTFSGFSGPRLTEWLGYRFDERSSPGDTAYDPMMMRMRQTAADSVEVFLPAFNSLPGIAGGHVSSLQLRYRHGRWQIFMESSNRDS